VIFAASASTHHFTCEERGGAVIVTFLRQQLTDEDNIEQLGEALFALLDKDARSRIILDLSQLDYVTSSVLGKFITLHRRLHRQGGALVLSAMQPNVREALRASRLLEYFQTADSVEAAQAALGV
jgi:anti-sigma B factor antagonist